MRLLAQPYKLWSLQEMERTGGEPDIIDFDAQTNVYVFCDCSAESPAGRRSLCYDLEGWKARKEHRPSHNALDAAKEIGIELMTEIEYRHLQLSGAFDTKTSSWIHTPPEIRKLGGALFAEFRYGNVFVYHNSAPSYYAARGFRATLRV